METRPLGTSDVAITPIILGTWQADRKGWSGTEESEFVKAIRTAVEAGIATIDTAEIYAEGRSEQLVAEAVSDIRDRVVYADKVFANHLKYDQVLAACDRSLKRLKTDYIDLYQIHWPSGSFNSEVVPVGETMEALNVLKEKGKIRAIGVSNFSRSQMEEAARHGRIDSLQPPYSLFWRDVERETMSYCVENNISILAYSSLAQGLLTGKFGPDRTFPEGDYRNKNKLFKNRDHYRRAQEALDRLRPIASEKGCTLAQLSLAWLIARPQTQAIVGASNPDQARQNAGAGEVRLSPEELDQIDRIGRHVTDHLEKDYPILWDF